MLLIKEPLAYIQDKLQRGAQRGNRSQRHFLNVDLLVFIRGKSCTWREFCTSSTVVLDDIHLIWRNLRSELKNRFGKTRTVDFHP